MAVAANTLTVSLSSAAALHSTFALSFCETAAAVEVTVRNAEV
jgi:hypothetical protein